MKRLLCVLCIISTPLQASSELRTVRKTKKGLRITTVASQGHHIPRQKSADTKAWKQAVLRTDFARLDTLEKNKHPKDTSLNRQNAMLGIIARKANKKDREELFNIGLRNNLYTVDTAVGAAKALGRHAQELARLAIQARNQSSKKKSKHVL